MSLQQAVPGAVGVIEGIGQARPQQQAEYKQKPHQEPSPLWEASCCGKDWSSLDSPRRQA